MSSRKGSRTWSSLVRANCSQVLQHTWTYKPLVHDVLGMDLSRITVDEVGSSNAVLPGAHPMKKSFEVGDGDFFWEANGRAQFPKVAAEVDTQIMQYKQVRFLHLLRRQH